MLCKRPYQKRRSGIVHPIYIKNSGYRHEITPFPCGQCFHCRINQARIWQTRLMLEAKDSIDSTFMTLTYDDDHIPWDYNLNKDHLTKFLKRYRKRLDHKIRYYAIGEYGDKTWRPHFHLAIFSEKILERCYAPCEDMRKRNLCTQDCIPRLSWPYGNISVTGELNQEMSGYITGYIKDKATKKAKINRSPEYGTMSRRPGIGKGAIERIATKLSNDPRSGQSVIRSLKFAGGSRPLGPYLSSALADKLGVSSDVIDDEFTRYSDSIIKEYLKDQSMLPEISRKNEGKRDRQRVKHTRFKRRRNL